MRIDHEVPTPLLCVNSGGTLLLISRGGIIIHEYLCLPLTLGKPHKKIY
jgi:hypothetical protein